MIVPEFKFSLVNTFDTQYLPTKSDPLATGWDVRVSEDVVLKPYEMVVMPLGIRCIIPDGWWLQICPRSSTFTKLDLHALYGVIDQNYVDPIKFAAKWMPSTVSHSGYQKINCGTRIAQLIPRRREEIEVKLLSSDEFDNQVKENRGGGFGSTGII
jgi:dUTP pyrophosphatase